MDLWRDGSVFIMYKRVLLPKRAMVNTAEWDGNPGLRIFQPKDASQENHGRGRAVVSREFDIERHPFQTTHKSVSFR